MSEHTPGPYEVEPAVDGGWAVTNGDKVLAVTLGAEAEDVERANADVFAAAPDMLEALEEIADAPNHECSPSHAAYMADVARAAIAKARGKA